MKKIDQVYLVVFMFLLSVLMFKPVFAANTGAIELNDFSSKINVVAGEKFNTYINFIYTGPEPYLGVSIVGNKLVDGLKLGYVSYGANGVDNITYSGVPTKVGDYPLKLVITDNNGVSAVTPFEVVVSGVTFTDSLLPDAAVNQSYTQNINYAYAGSDVPTISFYPSSSDLGIRFLNSVGSGGSARLDLNPGKPGNFTVRVEASLNGVALGSKVFSINVYSSVVAVPIVVINPSSQVIVATTTQQEKNKEFDPLPATKDIVKKIPNSSNSVVVESKKINRQPESTSSITTTTIVSTSTAKNSVQIHISLLQRFFDKIVMFFSGFLK